MFIKAEENNENERLMAGVKKKKDFQHWVGKGKEQI